MSLSRINDTLWLGSVGARNNLARLREAGIEVVVSVMTPDERETLCGQLDETMTEYDIDLDDHPRADLLKAVNKLVGILKREEGKKCLVHCQLGMSRSPALIVGYLMVHERLGLEATLKKVQEARPCTMLNEGFLNQLKGL